MRYYWAKDRIEQNQYKSNWKSGKKNKADYVTKVHSPAHHKK